MTRLKVNLERRSYDILTGRNVIRNCFRELKKLNLERHHPLVITNRLIQNLYGGFLSQYLKGCPEALFLNVPDSETSKSWRVLSEVLGKVVKFSRGKDVVLVALGGGVVGDLTGFLAAIYKRGVPYIQIPTTLLAQVDSSIGGKVAVDLKWGKNLIGAFYQPKLVIAELEFLKTLPAKEIRNGLSEIVKYALIKGEVLFSVLEKGAADILSWDFRNWLSIINICQEVKISFVEKDEYDSKDIRIILNLGHTVGHALEASLNYKSISHGEGVAFGILAESIISQKIGFLAKADLARILNLIQKLKCLPFLRKKVGVSDIMPHLFYDKKMKSGQLRFVVPETIGKIKVVTKIDSRLIKSAIKQALYYVQN